jgi:hypothetical protein
MGQEHREVAPLSIRIFNGCFGALEKSAISPILPACVTGQQFSKMDDSNRALAISVSPR